MTTFDYNLHVIVVFVNHLIEAYEGCVKFLSLKNQPRTLRNVALVVKNITATLYDTYFPGAEELRPGQRSRCPDSDIICIAWLLELIGQDSELAGYKMLKAELSDLFPHLPERSRFNRRRRNLCYMSDKLQGYSVLRVFWY